MTAAEIQARIVLINAAIDYVLTGKVESYRTAGRELTRLKLPDLEKMLATYEARLTAAQATQGGGGAAVIEFQEPSA